MKSLATKGPRKQQIATKLPKKNFIKQKEDPESPSGPRFECWTTWFQRQHFSLKCISE